MSTLLKDIYSKEFFQHFSETLQQCLPAFNEEQFIKKIYTKDWQQKEWKDRMRHISLVLHSFMPSDFAKAAKLINKIQNHLQKKQQVKNGFPYMFLPDYVEQYGLDYYESSVQCMELLTSFTSCEFAVRPFIIQYPDKMLQQMQQWSLHKNEHVRRLASEGSRPRLPWAMALPALKKQPAPLLAILENLKNDPSEYVRRSVANNLNDISKDNPGVLLAIVKKWKGQSLETDALLKHASRTLLKQGDTNILKLFGLADNANIYTEKFQLHTSKVKIGEYLQFSFSLENRGKKAIMLRMEYGMHYLRSNGQHSKKVFKISERELKPGEKISMQRKQSFKIITTRRFYPGLHRVSLIVNGVERSVEEFELRG
jgi:3-methyladenine DNA glycosylase AlkC